LLKFKESLIEGNVEISDDMFVLKAEDAQKLLEPPRLASLTIRPIHVVLKPGEQAAFTCSGLDQYGKPYASPLIRWSASCGSITPAGVYTADLTGGLHSIRVGAGEYEAIAEVRVSTDTPDLDDEDDDPIPGKRLIRWSGNVPPQKWMNFYTKVLTRFASLPDLKIEVSFEVHVPSEQAQAKLEETRSGLKELDLDDSPSMS
jgi:hypothetical protein